jgi:hypothetical protein
MKTAGPTRVAGVSRGDAKQQGTQKLCHNEHRGESKWECRQPRGARPQLGQAARPHRVGPSELDNGAALVYHVVDDI